MRPSWDDYFMSIVELVKNPLDLFKTTGRH